MTVTLIKEDCSNVKQCLVLAAKRPEITENEMTALLILSQKFNWTDPAPVLPKPTEPKKEKKETAK